MGHCQLHKQLSRGGGTGGKELQAGAAHTSMTASKAASIGGTFPNLFWTTWRSLFGGTYSFYSDVVLSAKDETSVLLLPNQDSLGGW